MMMIGGSGSTHRARFADIDYIRNDDEDCEVICSLCKAEGCFWDGIEHTEDCLQIKAISMLKHLKEV